MKHQRTYFIFFFDYIYFGCTNVLSFWLSEKYIENVFIRGDCIRYVFVDCEISIDSNRYLFLTYSIMSYLIIPSFFYFVFIKNNCHAFFFCENKNYLICFFLIYWMKFIWSIVMFKKNIIFFSIKTIRLFLYILKSFYLTEN